MAKVKVATDWLAACAGCHMSLLDLDERLVGLLDAIELTSTPITDLKHPPAEGVTVGVLTGAVNTTTNVAVARMMRKRCQCLVALGDCAVFGGVPALRNFCGIQAALQRAYVDAESVDESGKIPSDPELATMTNVRALSEVVPVDVFVPGCPPDADVIFYALAELAQGRIPVLKDELLHWH